MEVKVLWTETALNNLEDIFEYYKYKASVSVAKKIVNELVRTSLKIQNSPKIGRKEELLINRKFEYRFLISGKYKIIYWIEDNYIKISTVFDCRQNPEKIKKL
ncbi:MAG: type II toxin-antitoxin system RelE/ParE family toxin [Bacteroidota bacterium]|nr:type II toxin-antitoxin system RelE/ParE family toxin [Bacteroidota bacterium]